MIFLPDKTLLYFCVKATDFCIWHPVVDPQTEESHEAEAVQDCVVCVVVTDFVNALQDEDLEHQNLIIAGPTTLG